MEPAQAQAVSAVPYAKRSPIGAEHGVNLREQLRLSCNRVATKVGGSGQTAEGRSRGTRIPEGAGVPSQALKTRASAVPARVEGRDADAVAHFYPQMSSPSGLVARQYTANASALAVVS